jgi:hypothetical protein
MSKIKTGRPLDGKEVKRVYSIRLEPSMYRAVIKEFGTFTNAIMFILTGEKKKRKKK